METEYDYRVLVAFESLTVGYEFRSAPTIRLSALTAAGYLAVRSVEYGPWQAAETGQAALAAIDAGDAEAIVLPETSKAKKAAKKPE